MNKELIELSKVLGKTNIGIYIENNRFEYVIELLESVLIEGEEEIERGEKLMGTLDWSVLRAESFIEQSQVELKEIKSCIESVRRRIFNKGE